MKLEPPLPALRTSLAEDALEALRHVERLVRSSHRDGNALLHHIGWAKEALWAAAYPDDRDMLANVAYQAWQASDEGK